MSDKPKNKVELEGRVMFDPSQSIKYLSTGTALLTNKISVDASYGDQQKEESIPIKVWGDRAEQFANEVQKGDVIRVLNGKMSNRRWKDQQDKWRDDVAVVVFEWETVETNANPPAGGMGSELTFNDDDEVPF